MKISILWGPLASYTVTLFKEMALKQQCKLQIIYFGPSPEAPYSHFDLAFCAEAINRTERRDVVISQAVDHFSPDCIFMCSWNYYDYMKIARRFRRNGGFVVSTIDHQWESTPKQWLGVITRRWFLKPSIDCFLVAGDRQAYFAKKLGYDNVLYGLYSAQVEAFRTSKPLKDRKPSFLFIGRLSAEKGIKDLIKAYLIYRKQCASPWDLKIVGTGKLKYLLNNIPGVKAYGFVQPADLPKLMHDAKTFILPSKWEPWGVVIHEAAAAGLPIICTYQCGAVTSFVRDGVNGLIVQPSPADLKDAMLKMTSLGSERLERFGDASRALGLLWTPSKLARYLVENLKSKISIASDAS